MPKSVQTGEAPLITQEEGQRILNEMHGFISQWAFHPQIPSDSAIVIQSAETYQYGKDTEALIGIWIYQHTDTKHGTAYSFDEDNPTNAGTMITVGQESGRIYQFSTNTLFSAIKDAEIFADGIMVLDFRGN